MRQRSGNDEGLPNAVSRSSDLPGWLWLTPFFACNLDTIPTA